MNSKSIRFTTIVLSACAVTLLGAVALKYEQSQKEPTPVVEKRTRQGDVEAVVLLTEPLKMDRIYSSMQGPLSAQFEVPLMENASTPEKVWITGIDTQVLDADTLTPTSSEFFCHSTVSFNSFDPNSAVLHNAKFENKAHMSERIFTLVPGRLGNSLPAGFGIPMYSNERIGVVAMSLNENVVGKQVDVRFRTTVSLLRGDAGKGIKPVFNRTLVGLARIASEKDKELLEMQHSGQDNGHSCAAMPLSAENASTMGVVESLYGKENTLHWMVPPGRHSYSTDVTSQMALPFDTTIHYATGHLHPFAESVALRDATTGKELALIRSRDFSGKLGVEHMDEISSIEGIPVQKDHQYEITAVYNNTTDEPIDAMAIVYLYLLEKELI